MMKNGMRGEMKKGDERNYLCANLFGRGVKCRKYCRGRKLYRRFCMNQLSRTKFCVKTVTGRA